ncbi:hypothetical protein F4777DRAFT_591097 [Nemania sp. FL0916]|nr:hypothetical protein F4777DRAFT_591097 [Nemania sp. FL0916]
MSAPILVNAFATAICHVLTDIRIVSSTSYLRSLKFYTSTKVRVARISCPILAESSGGDGSRKHYEPISSADESHILDHFRHRLFGSEPTAVLCGLVDGDLIPVAEELKEYVLDVLECATRTGFDIHKQSIDSLLFDELAFQSIPADQQTEVREMVSLLVRLHFVVDDPEDIAILIYLNFMSAYSISNTPKLQFVQQITDAGIAKADAELIWTRSSAIHLRNQDLWIDRLRAKNEIAFKGALRYEESTVLGKPSMESANLTNLFTDLGQITDCAECSAITSPAAYFVDLLHQLSMRRINTEQTSPSLLQELFKRRPDLGDLKLSCANTKGLVPCIDLANEALESVASNGSAIVKNAYNMDDGQENLDEDTCADADNTNFEVYRKLIQPLVFPLTVFPYNQATDSVRIYFNALGSSRHELLTVFRAPYRLVTSTMIDDPAVFKMAQLVLDRAEYAEYLGILGEEYIAITHEAFQTRQYFDAINNTRPRSSVESYQFSIGLKAPSAYWGYADDETMTRHAGLTCVGDQFLPRSGLSLEQTLQLLRTRYLGRQLVISSTARGKQSYSGKVEEMRLRHQPPEAHESDPLSVDECDRLQSFLRLWRKLGWSLEDTDAAVVMLSGNRTTGVDPIVIEGLAEIKRISSMTKLAVGDILPLWGDMDTTSQKSVYARLFLSARVTREDPVFTPDSNGNYLPPSRGMRISKHKRIIQIALLLNEAELAVITSSSEWIDDRLTLRNISYIYRVAMFCRMLGISPVQYPKVLSLLPTGSNVFENPRSTRLVLEKFQKLKNLGWTIDTELYVVAGITDTTGVPAGFNRNDAIRTAVEIIKANMNGGQENSLPIPDRDSKTRVYTQEEVARVSAALFGTEAGVQVETFIEASQSPRSLIPPSSLVDRDSVQVVSDILMKLTRAAIPVSLCKLEREEVQYFQSIEGFDFGAPSFDNINLLCAYTDLRNSLPKPKGKEAIFPLVQLYKSLNNGESFKDLVKQLALVTGWPEDGIRAILEAKYPSLTEARLVNEFKSVTALCELRDCLQLISRLQLREASPSLLFSLADPVLPDNDITISRLGKTTERDFQDAAELRLVLCSRLKDCSQTFVTALGQLRTNQRTALVQYLLQQPYIQELEIDNVNALCEYFLIDVAVGPSMRTSRIKQAISTIQIFMQRCILDLEQRFGIPNSVISRDDYDRLMRYRLWEANRKAFLYPESWIDPSLRDDKSEQFRSIESKITQGKLTQESISAAIKDYVYAAHEVGDLEIQAYLWDRYDTTEQKSRLHFFARTRASPWQYYYRTLDLVGDIDNQASFWKPWEKMSVEVQSHELSGKVFYKLSSSGCYMLPAILNGRLFLFLPHFTLSDVLDDNSKKETSSTLADKQESQPAKKKKLQMRMGWTEYRHGKWTKKQLSDSILSIEGTADAPEEERETDPFHETADVHQAADDSESDDEQFARKLLAIIPGIQTFKFWISEREGKTTTGAPRSILVIDVERWVGPLGSGWTNDGRAYHEFYAYKLGAFEWRDERVVLVKPSPAADKWPWHETVPTNFMKLAWKVWRHPYYSHPTNTFLGQKPLLAKLPKSDDGSMYSFTMSFATITVDVPSGIVVDVSTADKNHCMIGYPPSDAINSRIDSEVGYFFNTASPVLLEASFGDLSEIYKVISGLEPKLHYDAFGQRKREIPHELGNPYSLYTWEVGLHIQYDLALSVARLVFDPAAIGPDSDVTKCWKFPPFREPDIQTQNTAADGGSNSANRIDFHEWDSGNTNVHAVARARPVAYMKRIVLKYIEILIALGDHLFRQNTLEILPLAIQSYIEASQLFGPAPIAVPQLAKRSVWSYNKLEKSNLDSLSNALVKMELDFPFRAREMPPMQMLPFIETGYFCIPANPQIAALRALLDDRLYKCRNSLDIDGHEQTLPLFEPPMDPGALVRATAAGMGPSAVVSDLATPMPRYRFTYLLERALELCRELKDTDTRALVAKEKKDAEALSALSARHNTAVHELIVEVKRAQREEELAALKTLEETRRAHVSRLAFYHTLTGDPLPNLDGKAGWQDIPQSIDKPTTNSLRMSPSEKREMETAAGAVVLNSVVNQFEELASIFDAFPAIFLNVTPFGVGTSVEASPAILARVIRAGARSVISDAQALSDESRLVGMAARLENQVHERRELANEASREIRIVDRRLSEAKSRLAVCDKDILQQQKQLETAGEMEEWLRAKYTSAELYAWMDKEYGMVFQRAYSLASEVARQAQRAFSFERPAEKGNFLTMEGGGYWDSARNGMLSAENMWLDLKKMELAYRGKRSHDFELVKYISLRQLDPWALMMFRETGHAEFSLPEFLFDIDFPGHYCRRIHSVSLTIPCIVGPYASLNCTLRLKKHTYRISQDASSSTPYPEAPGGDLRFRTDNIPIKAIAIGSPDSNSGGTSSGSFSFGFPGDSYSPFEGAGVISTWQIYLPPELRQFEYHTISDVVLQLRYTALDGGVLLGKAATETVLSAIGQQTSPLALLVNVSSDYASGWYGFQSALRNGKEAHLNMPGIVGMLPFWTQRLSLNVESISAIMFPAPASGFKPEEMKIAEYSGLVWKTQEPEHGGYLVVEAKGIKKPLVRDWTVTLPNGDGVKQELTSLWFLIRYYRAM